MGELISNFMIDMRQVFFVLGILLFIISYVKDSLDFYGYYFIFGVISVVVSFVCYILYFSKKLN
jgi:hypothetical protein